MYCRALSDSYSRTTSALSVMSQPTATITSDYAGSRCLYLEILMPVLLFKDIGLNVSLGISWAQTFNVQRPIGILLSRATRMHAHSVSK